MRAGSTVTPAQSSGRNRGTGLLQHRGRVQSDSTTAPSSTQLGEQAVDAGEGGGLAEDGEGFSDAG